MISTMSDDFLTEFPDEGEADEPRPMAYFPAGLLSEIPEGGGKSVWVKTRKVAVFNLRGRILAVKDRCPHMGASLSDGRVSGGTVVCGWHGWTFDLGTGNCVNKDWAKLVTYRVRVSGDRLEVEVPIE